MQAIKTIHQSFNERDFLTLYKNDMKYYLTFLIFLLTTLGFGQKRPLTTEDYNLWNTLGAGPISNDGNWLTYIRNYQTADTVFIKNLHNDRLFSFPSAGQVQFSDDSKYATFQKKDSIHLLTIETGERRSYATQGTALFTAGSMYFVRHDVAKRQLRVLNLKNDKEVCIEEVNAFYADPLQKSAVLTTGMQGKERVQLIKFTAKLPMVVLPVELEGKYRNFSWNKKGTHFAFLVQNEATPAKNTVVYCTANGSIPVVKQLDNHSKNVPSNGHIAPSLLHVSDDGERVFFEMNFPPTKKDTATEFNPLEVQIWRTNAKQLAPRTKKGYDNQGIWLVWHPATGTIQAIESKQHPHAVLTGDQKNALVFNTTDYLPQFKYGEEYVDMYLLDLASGEKHLAISKQINRIGQTIMSPTGKYIAYFKEKNWWTYEIATKKHTCLTADKKTSFFNTIYDKAGTAPAYPFGGWTVGDKELILYDTHDIWLFKAEGTSSRKLTEGSKAQRAYRIYDDGLVLNNVEKIGGFTSKTIDLSQTVIITSENNYSLSQGIALWNPKKGIRDLVTTNRKIFSLQKIKDTNALTYFEATFDHPSSLNYVKEGAPPIVVAKSNEQHSNFYWGKSEVIHYEVDGEQLKGALFYPAQYSPDKKYPLIVNIYEKPSKTVHHYIPPSGKSDNGFSTTDLTQQGFFILCPDISYTINEPGPSALKWVNAAVTQALATCPIDANRMGLMGHSFGGYETTYIIANSNRFKAAIAGAAVTDLRSLYLSINNDNRPTLNLFESYQLRLKKPFYGPELKRNNPIENIQNVETPLLLWTSDSDPVVPPTQSTSFHTGLWRLGKKSTLLVYPQEDHSLLQEENQKDLSTRVSEWFTYYLKDGQKPNWL